MVLVLDTNIVLLSIVNASFDSYFQSKYRKPENDFVISVVSEGELLSLAFQRNWGQKKISLLQRSLETFLVYPIRVRSVIDTYAKIDAYSQGKLVGNPLPTGMTARNMGKNDLWIAATAHVTDATLLTTDKDFSHLNGVFMDVELVNISDFL